MAGRRSKSDARPSIHSVAAYAGVSTATVSKVMHGDPTIRPENVKSVQNAIEALGYRINPLAAELRRGRRKVIGAIVPNYDDPFLSGLMDSLERHAEQRGYGLTTMSSRDLEARETELVGRMEDWRVSGVIIVPVRSKRSPAATLLRDSGIATVFIDRASDLHGFDSVSADFQSALERVAREVAGLGHRRILVPDRGSPSDHSRDPEQLKEGLEQAAADMRVELLNCAVSHGKLAVRIRSALNRKARPTAVLSFSEPAVMLALNEAKSRSWAIPADLSVFSFQPARWMNYHEPPIATMERPSDAIAGRAVEFLFNRIEKPGAPSIQALESCHIDCGRSLARVPEPPMSAQTDLTPG